MTIQTIKQGFYIPDYWLQASTSTPSAASVTINAADEKVAHIFQAPKTGTVSKVCFATGTVTTGATVDVRLETVDGTTGFPSGTLWATNTNASQVIANSDDNKWFSVTLTATASVTKGDILAVVVVNPGTSFGNMVIATVALSDVPNLPYTALYDGGSWTIGGQHTPVVALEYNDGSYEPGIKCLAAETYTSYTFNNSSTPDVRGNKFKFPFPCRVSGLWAHLDNDGDWVGKLYDSDGVTVLAQTPTVDKDYPGANSSPRLGFFQFTSTATLTKDTWYRIGIEPSSATSLTLYAFTVPSAAVMDANPLGQNMHFTTAKDPTGTGSWTDTTTERAFIGLIVDGFDDGTSGGGGGTIAYVF